VNTQTLLQELQQLHHGGRLCLFVGAGVSESCGLPNWDTLSNRVVLEAFRDEVPLDLRQTANRNAALKKPPLGAMRAARRVLKERFNSVVKECLYSTTPELSEAVKAIALLRNVRNICCFNYDDVLEVAYEQNGTTRRPVTEGDELRLHSDDVLIFHPHGFLPRSGFERKYSEERIIISEDDYHKLYSSPDSWPNMIQISLLMSFSILFIGCSLVDPNIRRLLDICKRVQVGNKYYSLSIRPTYAYGPEWYRYLMSSRQFEEDDLLDRGVTPIWYKDHLDVPGLLSNIL
jgi:hypothetical protein